MESDLRVIVKGLPDGLADEVGETVLAAVGVLVRRNPELDFRRMRRVVVTADFAGELSGLSETAAPHNRSTHTNEDYAVAVARVVTLPQDESYEIVPVISAKYMLPLVAPEGTDEGVGEEGELSRDDLFAMALNGLHHELCHVHDNNKAIDVFGAPTTSERCSGKDAYVRSLAEACWSEYIADFMSSPTVSGTWLGIIAGNLSDAIERTKPKMDNEILAYRHHGDITRLLNAFQRHGVFLAKAAAYVLGYLDGLDVTLDELSPEASDRLSDSYFDPTWDAMHATLREMKDLYPDGWREPNIYLGLDEVMERYYEKMGLVLSTVGDGDVWVDVPYSPETTPGF